MKSLLLRYIGSHSDSTWGRWKSLYIVTLLEPGAAKLTACLVAGLNLLWGEIEHKDYFPGSQFSTGVQLCDLECTMPDYNHRWIEHGTEGRDAVYCLGLKLGLAGLCCLRFSQ